MSAEATIEVIRVRYGETDQMGHAYYANYLYWFEQARGAWCRARGFNYSDVEKLGILMPVVEVHARYRGEVHYDDLIEVKVWAGEIKRAAIKFEYEIRVQGREGVVTEGYSWHVFMSPETRKAITLPSEIREWMTRSPCPNSENMA